MRLDGTSNDGGEGLAAAARSPARAGSPPDAGSPTDETPRRNLRLLVAYRGTAYAGWQIQPTAPTVQGVLESVLVRLTGQRCRLRGAGRTDAGVHAEGQIANFRSATRLSCAALLRGLNALLPADIVVRSVEEVAPDFDSRRHNLGKHYRYAIWNQAILDPAHAATTWHLRRPLDCGAMAEAAPAFVGTHDFAAFRSASCESESTVRTLFRASVSVDGPLVQIHVEGTAFLQHMVRIIGGTLVEVGRGQRDPASIRRLLEGGTRAEAGLTAPACGLTLVRVFLA